MIRAMTFFTILAFAAAAQAADDGWVSLFNGKDLSGWKVSENPSTITVADGAIVCHGPRAHAFYVGEVNNHDFKNFVFKADVMTEPGSNAGLYFHTNYLESGWPDTGFEVQVNNTHKDFRKTGSLYAVQDVTDQLVKDNEWFTEEITVEGNHVTIKVNGKTVVEYDQPENPAHLAKYPGRKIAHGTFAIQGHDPMSKVYFKNIMVKPLP